MIRVAILAALLALQRPAPRPGHPVPPGPEECTPHICHCKGMQEAVPPDDDEGNPNPEACKKWCVKGACCCPKPEKEPQ